MSFMSENLNSQYIFSYVKPASNRKPMTQFVRLTLKIEGWIRVLKHINNLYFVQYVFNCQLLVSKMLHCMCEHMQSPVYANYLPIWNFT